MIALTANFNGHRGAVTALAPSENNHSFYSGGADGLIIRWDLKIPNEGEVILKLQGYIACIAYNAEEKLLYVSVNHKGVYVISNIGKIVAFIDIPATSFGKIKLVLNSIVLSTGIGEVLVLERSGGKIQHRIITGLTTYPPLACNQTEVWFASVNEVNRMNLVQGNQQSTQCKFVGQINTISLRQSEAVLFSSHGVFCVSYKNIKISSLQIFHQSPSVKNIVFNQACFNLNDSTFLGLTDTNLLIHFNVLKNELNLLNQSENEHKDPINDILWIENYKFVVTADSDSKIGVWQLHQNSSS
ncbi:MAG: hypothetical protein L3J06_08635 [Cyclobacteriaceae bacterium]|nr:hypothetical protein [Cyclobacteriaceae bacterium]